MKKRYILLIVFIALIVLGSVIAFTRPVLPVISLPGECYPGTATGFDYFPCVTNTLVTTFVAFSIVTIMVLALRAKSRTADEVPTGFYNFFEMIIEGGYKYATGLSGSKKAKDFFPLFMTLILYILVANWLELIPGVDSVGFYEYIPHLTAENAGREAEKLAEKTGVHLSEEELHAIEHEAEELSNRLNEGDFRVDPFLIKNPDNAIEGDFKENDPRAGQDPETADWAVTAFFRAPATDLNFTVAMALVTMFLVQYYGFKYLGIGYLKKFFPWDSNVDAMAKNPIKAIDWAVGILEIVGEFSRILSFSFRLLGNIFAGQVLLFVIATLVPAISVAFFGLEFFVGLIQAVVFGLLALMFMSGATEQHGDDEHHD